MASLNLQGQLIITDTNGAQRLVNLNTPVTYTLDYEATYTVAASGTAVIYNSADTAVPVTSWAAMFLFPSGNLDLSMGNDSVALSSAAAWNSIPLTASQPFVLFRNGFYCNYVNGAATNIFAGTSTATNRYMKVSNPSSTTAATVQIFLCS